MDFTYYVAFVLALLVGGITATVLVLARKPLNAKGYRVSVTFAVALDFLLLVNWSALPLEEAWVLSADLLFFSLYSLVGCALGMLPVKAVRAIVRRLRR